MTARTRSPLRPVGAACAVLLVLSVGGAHGQVVEPESPALAAEQQPPDSVEDTDPHSDYVKQFEDALEACSKTGGLLGRWRWQGKHENCQEQMIEARFVKIEKDLQLTPRRPTGAHGVIGRKEIEPDPALPSVFLGKSAVDSDRAWFDKEVHLLLQPRRGGRTATCQLIGHDETEDYERVWLQQFVTGCP